MDSQVSSRLKNVDLTVVCVFIEFDAHADMVKLRLCVGSLNFGSRMVTLEK